jgi:DNA polymerase III delta prime subunit
MEPPFIYKYQPVRLNDFETSDDFKKLISTLLNMNSLNILLFGDSGSGKSSMIQAILKEYYQSTTLPLENVMFINSLKEQGITFYRNEVKTFCQTASLIIGKKKVIVLDDLDIINEQSQQVFRNCIDKYSHSVHFIGSCTNTQKVIDSLQSRMTIIKVKMVPKEGMFKIIRHICEQENIQMTREAEDFIVSISNSSVRTTVNYLEKFKLLEMPVTVALAISVCTNISFQDFITYTALVSHDRAKAIEFIYRLFDRGYSVMDILDNYFLFIKSTDLLSEQEKYNIIPLICKYITIFHNVHEDEIELALFTNEICGLYLSPLLPPLPVAPMPLSALTALSVS